MCYYAERYREIAAIKRNVYVREAPRNFQFGEGR